MADLNEHPARPDDRYRGIIAAMYTPLTADERLDAESCERLAHRLLDEGQAGLYLAGNTGEWYGLDDEVRADVFRVAARAAASRSDQPALIAHVGGLHTRRTIALARAASDAGCDAVSAITPAGVRYEFDEVFDYYGAVADSSPLPVFVYHIPATTGCEFSLDQLSRLLALPNVAGLKFTSPDLFQLERLAARHPDRAIFMGTDQMLIFGLLAGARGGIGTTYNAIGPAAVKAFRAVERGDIETARAAQAIINRFVRAFQQNGGMRGLKALVAERGNWPAAVSPAPARAVPRTTWAPLGDALDRALAEAAALP